MNVFMTNIPNDCELNAHSSAISRPTLGAPSLSLSLNKPEYD